MAPDTSRELSPTEAEFTINNLRHVQPFGGYTGEQVRHFVHPAIGDDRDLYLVQGWNEPDLLVTDDMTVSVVTGARFFTLPRFINGG